MTTGHWKTRIASVAGTAIMAMTLVCTGAPAAQAQGIQLPTLRVQTNRITRGIQTNLRLARNARLVIKPGEAIEVHELALSSPRFLVTGPGRAR